MEMMVYNETNLEKIKTGKKKTSPEINTACVDVPRCVRGSFVVQHSCCLLRFIYSSASPLSTGNAGAEKSCAVLYLTHRCHASTNK